MCGFFVLFHFLFGWFFSITFLFHSNIDSDILGLIFLDNIVSHLRGIYS